MTIYIRCCHCGTMKPNATDPDDELAAINAFLSDIDTPTHEGDERLTTLARVEHLARGLTAAVDMLRANRDRQQSLPALRGTDEVVGVTGSLAGAR